MANKKVSDIVEDNARLLLSTYFEGVNSEKNGIKGDIALDKAITVHGENINTNIEVKYKNSLGPSLEFNEIKGDGEEVKCVLKVNYDEDVSGKVNSVELFKDMSGLSERDIWNDRAVIHIITNYLTEEINNNDEFLGLIVEDVSEEMGLNKRYQVKHKSRDLSLSEMSDKAKERILDLLYDREGFNEKVFCCVNDTGHFTIIPRDGEDGVRQYYSLIPKLVVRKGDNNVTTVGWSPEKLSNIMNEIKYKYPDIGIVEVRKEKISKNNRIYAIFNKKIENYKEITFLHGNEEWGLTYAKIPTIGEDLYRYKIIKKHGTYRFKLLLNIISNKERMNKLFSGDMNKNRISPEVKMEYRDVVKNTDYIEKLWKVSLCDTDSIHELVNEINSIK